MSTLLMRLSAPLQAWGADAKFDRRGTERAPTKSGIIGLAAAALGRRRGENLEDLNALRFGVRVDQEGQLLRDYHTARNEQAAYVTHRYYLSDAVFLAGLQGEEALLARIAHALQNPVFPLFLGRRSCPPEGKVLLGIRKDMRLEQALQAEPWLASSWMRRKGKPPCRLRMITDADGSARNAYYMRDVPLSFSQSHRRFGFRAVVEHEGVITPAQLENTTSTAGSLTAHDAMQELGG